MIFANIIVIATILLLLLLFIYTRHDPTVPWREANQRLIILIEKSQENHIVAISNEQFSPDKIPWRTRYRYNKTNRLVVTGFPNSSRSLIIEIKGKYIRFYSHYYNGRTAAFTLQYPKGLELTAKQIATNLYKEFPGLPVTIEQSNSLKTTP
jgi:hypothetical protein